MGNNSVLFFLTPDPVHGSAVKPLMLQPVLFCPALRWVAQSMTDCGIRRFFVVCDETYAQEAADCLPADAEVTVCSFDTYKAALPAFMDGMEGSLLLANRALLPVEWEGGGLYELPRSEAEEHLAELSTYRDGDCADELDFSPAEDMTAFQALSQICRRQIIRRHMQNGVFVMDPDAVYIDPRVKIGAGTVLLPGTILRGETVIGQNCEIGPNAMIRDCTVGDGTVINASQANESHIGSHTRIGPFAYLRPNCTVADHVKIGDFVEVKNSTIGDHTSVSHLTYIGDSDVGERVNFGCGTVTTNYDGAKKYRCSIGSGSFIGCNTNLVAPVSVGDGAYIAAGSTITKNVPADALAIARVREETVKENWAAKRRAMLKSKY